MKVSKKHITIKLPETQLVKLLGFADEMLTMVEADNLSSKERVAAKQLRHIFNKTFQLYRDQVDAN